MAILTDSGRAAVATAIKAQAIHLAWGSGATEWDASQPPESIATTALLAEVGRRRVTQAMFCTPSANGEIIVADGRFAISADPTKYLYLRFAFDFEDSSTAIIRELGVFIGTVVESTVPENTDYVTPDQLENAGQLLVLEYIQKLQRSPQIRQQFEFIVQF